MTGERYDLKGDEAVYKGADWFKEFQLINPDTGEPYDLTDCTVTAEAREYPDDPAPAFVFDATVPADRAAQGVIRLALDHTATSAIETGGDARRSFHYDAELGEPLPSGKIHKVIIPSTVQVVAEYTR